MCSSDLVYIPHPDRADLHWSLQLQPYAAINLVLLAETRENLLRARGYLASLREPDPDHPTTYWLTLSNDKRVITVEFQCTLEDDGEAFTIDAIVEISESPGRRDRRAIQLNSSAPDSPDRADCLQAEATVSWTDSSVFGWRTRLDHERVRLRATGAGTVIVDLALDFAGGGSYVLRVDVLSEASLASSAVELAMDRTAEVEKLSERVHYVAEAAVGSNLSVDY